MQGELLFPPPPGSSCWRVSALTQVWSQSQGQEGFNPNLLLSRLTAWHTWAMQLHFPLIYSDAWMAGWREIDWRGNGLIVRTLAAGMQIASTVASAVKRASH